MQNSTKSEASMNIDILCSLVAVPVAGQVNIMLEKI